MSEQMSQQQEFEVRKLLDSISVETKVEFVRFLRALAAEADEEGGGRND